MSSTPPSRPRQIHLIKQPGVVSFGFNVTASRSDPFRYIGIVVGESLAKQAGLRSGDRVFEVNGVRVDGIPLPDVQGLVAKGGPQVQLVVADPVTDKLYTERNIVIRSGLTDNICIQVPSEDNGHTNDQTEMETEVMDAEVVDADAFISTTVMDDDDDVPPPAPETFQDEHTNGVVVTSHEPCPFKARLCTIKKWPDYQGFGFVLHGDKEEPGQNIGKVEPGSPSEAAGVRPGDRLIEVNGENVEREFQQDVVRRIANGPVAGQTIMLLVDPDALRFFRGHNMAVHSSMVDIERIETPPRALVSTVTPTAKVRLCHVKKWPDFQGYGFVLHGERGTPGTYLTNIDPGSPAEAAGLQDGDKIIEINGINVESEEQPQAIARIQMGVDGDSNQTRLLVADAECDRYFKRQNIAITGSMADVVYITNPDRTPPIVLTDPLPEPEPEHHYEHEHEHLPHPESALNGPRARLCHLKKWTTFDGYGFYLTTKDEAEGIFIGGIDPDSPAEAAGLRRGDRIIEVNGSNCESDSQNDLVQKVVAVPQETRLLVVDDDTYKVFLTKGVLVNGNMTDVDIIECPDR